MPLPEYPVWSVCSPRQLVFRLVLVLAVLALVTHFAANEVVRDVTWTYWTNDESRTFAH